MPSRWPASLVLRHGWCRRKHCWPLSNESPSLGIWWLQYARSWWCPRKQMWEKFRRNLLVAVYREPQTRFAKFQEKGKKIMSPYTESRRVDLLSSKKEKKNSCQVMSVRSCNCYLRHNNLTVLQWAHDNSAAIPPYCITSLPWIEFPKIVLTPSTSERFQIRGNEEAGRNTVRGFIANFCSSLLQLTGGVGRL